MKLLFQCYQKKMSVLSLVQFQLIIEFKFLYYSYLAYKTQFLNQDTHTYVIIKLFTCLYIYTIHEHIIYTER